MDSPAAHLPPKMEQGGNVRVITFTDGDVRDVENMIARELDGLTDGLGETHLLLDFTNVERLSSAELGTLIRLHTRMKASGGRLTLFNLNARIYEIFTVTHLQTLLGICRETDMQSVSSESSTANKGLERHTLDPERADREDRWSDDGGQNQRP
jgi:anti-anti-sigma factor